jgi:hypothetical protein
MAVVDGQQPGIRACQDAAIGDRHERIVVAKAHA